MNADFKKEYFKTLEKKVLEITEEAALDKSDDSPILRAAFTTMRDGQGPAFFETNIIDTWEGMPFLYICVIPVFAIEKDAMEETKKMIENLNFHIPIGTLGVHLASSHLFWRYSLVIEDYKSPEDLAQDTIVLYQRLAAVIGAMYDAMERVATGKNTFEKEVEAGKLIDQ